MTGKEYRVRSMFQLGENVEIMAEDNDGVYPFLLHISNIKSDLKTIEKGCILIPISADENAAKRNFQGINAADVIYVADPRGNISLLYQKS